MPLTTTIKRQVGNGPELEYRVTYMDDDSERAKAVSFFNGLSRPPFPSMRLPDFIYQMNQKDAQEYLDSHQLIRNWSILSIIGDNITENEFEYINQIPEVKTLKLLSNHITDDHIKRLCPKICPEDFILYSDAVTDECLGSIGKIKSIQCLDLQGSPNISCEGYYSTIGELPNHGSERYPPHAG